MKLAYLTSAVLAYTCDPYAPTETYCMTAAETWGAGMHVLLTPVDCLPELWGEMSGVTCLPLEDDLWVEAIAQRLADLPAPGPRQIPYEKTYAALAERWESELGLV